MTPMSTASVNASESGKGLNNGILVGTVVEKTYLAGVPIFL